MGPVDSDRDVRIIKYVVVFIFRGYLDIAAGGIVLLIVVLSVRMSDPERGQTTLAFPTA